MKAEIYIANENRPYTYYCLVYPGTDIVIRKFETEAGLRKYAKKHGYILPEVS